MRLLILAAGAAIALTACGTKDHSDNTSSVDENLTAANIVSNDVTAIDAVTGDAANMAADVNYTFESDNALDNGIDNSTEAAPPPEKPKARPAPKPAPRKEPVEPVANSAANATE